MSRNTNIIASVPPINKYRSCQVTIFSSNFSMNLFYDTYLNLVPNGASPGKLLVNDQCCNREFLPVPLILEHH
uniref:Putative ovule protein n=1 Tax=Solanum chacoense TaxID=4108 RepID=A0A0V0HWH7_SOLCH